MCACLDLVTRPSACLDTVPWPSAMTCLRKMPLGLAPGWTWCLGLVLCLATVPRPNALKCLDKVPRPNAMPSNGASALCHYMPRQGALP